MEGKYTNHLVFGLDIGTRSVVGTVGFKERDTFNVIAQYVKEHDTRAMLDGQIHDINKVGDTIRFVKNKLEEQVGKPLTEVCIAAAGRMLKTVTVHVDYELPEETVINQENIYSLDLLGVEKAHDELYASNNTGIKFYCVGYSVIRYYLNDYIMGNLENHKGKKISADIIATFLPEEVVDSLNSAVEIADLQVANLTLEPIAAINVAIPDMYRMLNIALVDVGAGTSDISITKDGSIVAYGMIPCAGDEITEVIAKHCLIDFKSAENIKFQSISEKETVQYKDIIGNAKEITPEEIRDITNPIVADMTKLIAEKIIELNGDKSVSAVFVVGGGGKIAGFTDYLADALNIPRDRVALRGEEVLGEVNFFQPEIKKDPLLVTPIGICLNFYDQKNNFIFVNFNGERIKLYNNNRLTVVDASMQAGYSNENLFPRRGKELNFSVNGKQRMVRGELGEAATISLNGEIANINSSIEANDKIQIIASTAGADAQMAVEQLAEYNATIELIVDDIKIVCPRFVEVNGNLVSGYYEIQDGDNIEMLNYYTVKQVLEFMDIIPDMTDDIFVNNKIADEDTKVYDNFTMNIKKMPENYQELKLQELDKHEEIIQQAIGNIRQENEIAEKERLARINEAIEGDSSAVEEKTEDNQEIKETPKEPIIVNVLVNDKIVTLKGKPSYVFVDIFDWIDFDLKNSGGKDIVTMINGRKAAFMETLTDGDKIEVYWKE